MIEQSDVTQVFIENKYFGFDKEHIIFEEENYLGA